MELAQKKVSPISTIKELLQCYQLAVVLLCFGFLCWLNQNGLLCILGYAVVFIAIFIFADDVKNMFVMIFSLPFFLNKISTDTNWNIYICAIAVGFSTVLGFLIRTIVLEKKNLKKGGMAIGFLLALLAFTLGGLARPNLVSLLIMLALLTSTYIVYFFAVNKTKHFDKYIAFILVGIGLTVMAESIIVNLNNRGIIDFNNPEYYCAEHRNTVAIFIMLGICGAFGLFYKSRFNWVFLLLGALLYFGIITTCCRTIILLGAVAYISLTIVGFIFAKNKLIFGSMVIALVLGIVLFFVIRKDIFNKLISMISSKAEGGISGRGELWKWCFSKFSEYPFFGYGFTSNETIPSLTETMPIILAHNTVLQWLTCLGIVGTTIICGFYYNKYYLLFSGFNKKRVFILVAILCVALDGALDQAPTMDFFVFLFPIIAIACIETQNKSIQMLK